MPTPTQCIAPECKNGLVFGEVCRACKGTGIIMRLYVVHEQYPHRDVATFHTMEDAQAYLRTAAGKKLTMPVILTARA